MKLNEQTFTVLGGDKRLLYTAMYLQSKGHNIGIYGIDSDKTDYPVCAYPNLETAMQNPIIILPLPLTKDGKMLNAPLFYRALTLSEIMPYIRKDQVISGGNIPAPIKKQLTEKGSIVIDYYADEELILRNARLTAQGIVSILLNDLPLSLLNLKAGISGFGRVAQYTAGMLKSLGADVTVFARNPLDLVRASQLNLCAKPLSVLKQENQYFDCFINTVPACVLGEQELNLLNRDCYLLETASEPYGINRACAEKLKFTFKNAPGIPGKIAPQSSGYAIGETVLRLIKEVNECNP